MHDRSDRPQSKVSVIGKHQQNAPASDAAPEVLRDRQIRKRLGDYLVEAGLITAAQIDVALNDQQMTSMKFGEILVARGWVKEQTIEYFMKKLVVPERRSLEKRARQQAEADRPKPPAEPAQQVEPAQRIDPARSAQQPDRFVRREVPISKPLPSVKSTDGDVNWVG